MAKVTAETITTAQIRALRSAVCDGRNARDIETRDMCDAVLNEEVHGTIMQQCKSRLAEAIRDALRDSACIDCGSETPHFRSYMCPARNPEDA